MTHYHNRDFYRLRVKIEYTINIHNQRPDWFIKLVFGKYFRLRNQLLDNRIPLMACRSRIKETIPTIENFTQQGVLKALKCV